MRVYKHACGVSGSSFERRDSDIRIKIARSLSIIREIRRNMQCETSRSKSDRRKNVKGRSDTRKLLHGVR